MAVDPFIGIEEAVEGLGYDGLTKEFWRSVKSESGGLEFCQEAKTVLISIRGLGRQIIARLSLTVASAAHVFLDRNRHFLFASLFSRTGFALRDLTSGGHKGEFQSFRVESRKRASGSLPTGSICLRVPSYQLT